MLSLSSPIENHIVLKHTSPCESLVCVPIGAINHV